MSDHQDEPRRGHEKRSVETLAEHAKDHRHHAWCNSCDHGQPFDLAPWIERLGPDYRMMPFRKRLVCSRCGSKDVRLVGSYCGRPS
jgi:Zn finger protein HypA/HybF involved in hydrogenase expression